MSRPSTRGYTPLAMSTAVAEELITRYAGGETSTAIGEALGLLPCTVRWALRRMAAPMRRSGVARQPIESRFWAKVARGKPDECWLWTGMIGSTGYGTFSMGGPGMRKAHRVAFFLAHGHWPNIARHTCDVPLCCNPSHLLDGTVADNARDMVERGRVSRHPRPRGSKHGLAKLTEEDVVNIRTLAGFCTRTQLARAFGVQKSNIAFILRRATWKHI